MSTSPTPISLPRELVPVARLELPHPTLPGVALVVWIYPACCEAAWTVRGRTIWRGLPCEA